MTDAGSGYTSVPNVSIEAPPSDIVYTTYWSNDGSSTNGSEPTSFINIAVNEGLFTVGLGDTALIGMGSISNTIFYQPNLQLRIWFNDGVAGFAALSPLQNLTPAPYTVASFLSLAQFNVLGLTIQTNASGGPNLVAGSPGNSIAAGVVGSVIAGGGATDYNEGSFVNTVAANFSTIGGGGNNTIQLNSSDSFLGGGLGNIIQSSASFCFLGGGESNSIEGGSEETFLGGGSFNSIGTNSSEAFLGGGFYNSIETNATDSVLAGGEYNSIGGGAYQSALCGGSDNSIAQNAYGAFLGAGQNNLIEADTTLGGWNCFIGSGYLNSIFAAHNSFIGGGWNNTIQSNAYGSVISGGSGSIVQSNAYFSFVGGGSANTVLSNGNYSTIPGGVDNTAADFAFAAGYFAEATNTGSFVWSDGTGTPTGSLVANSVTMRASGGFQFLTSTGTGGASLAPGATSWAVISDKNVKKNFAPVDGAAVLEKLATIPVQTWNYKWEKDGDTPNIGPMAQEFKAAFYPGRDDKSITTLEFDGVELAAIKGLNEKLEEKEAQIQRQTARITDLEARLEKLERLLEKPGQ